MRLQIAMVEWRPETGYTVRDWCPVPGRAVRDGVTFRRSLRRDARAAVQTVMRRLGLRCTDDMTERLQVELPRRGEVIAVAKLDGRPLARLVG